MPIVTMPIAWTLILSMAASQSSAYLASTGLIESDHPRIRRLVADLTGGLETSREKAVRIHDFVRDEIAFGWTRRFYRMPATSVLDARVGYCHTKATLFISMLRAAGIPARQRFVDISSPVLQGFLDRGQPHLDHSFTEVHLDGRWVGLDSYVVDLALYEPASRRLAETGAGLGYGLHAHGTPHWDGRSDAFAQLVDDGSVPGLTTRDHGVYADVGAFYDAVDGHDRLAGADALLIPLFVPRATAKVEEVRDGR